MQAMKAMNTKLSKKVKSLEQKIYDKEHEKMTILRNHKKDTDALKKRHEKAVDDQSQENKKQSDEIRQLKATIESLEKTIRDLKARLDIARKKDNKEEIKRLKESISRLEEEKAEKKTAFENLEKKYTRDLQAVEYNLSSKIADLSDQMAYMNNNLEMLILHNQGQNTRIGKDQIQRKSQDLPPVRSQSHMPREHPTDDKPPWNSGTRNISPRTSKRK